MLEEGLFKGLRVAYQRYAEDAVSDSFGVATFNGLEFDRHAEEGFAPIREAWRERSATLGREVRVEAEGGEFAAED